MFLQNRQTGGEIHGLDELIACLFDQFGQELHGKYHQMLGSARAFCGESPPTKLQGTQSGEFDLGHVCILRLEDTFGDNGE